MPITIKRRDNESNERLLRRFSRRIQTSGLLLRTKRRQYFERDKNEGQMKKDALRKLSMHAKEEYLRKIGEITEDTYGRTRGKGGAAKKRGGSKKGK
ncbi:MAG: 30S ribosomal protein S21 [Patescibacteria group bacterium]|nr:30S ribosomal protein S21 [bacterium]MDZ4221512.1 30S ribosomal protein S21 [Patescibacteria group bacterium]